MQFNFFPFMVFFVVSGYHSYLGLIYGFLWWHIHLNALYVFINFFNYILIILQNRYSQLFKLLHLNFFSMCRWLGSSSPRWRSLWSRTGRSWSWGWTSMSTSSELCRKLIRLMFVSLPSPKSYLLIYPYLVSKFNNSSFVTKRTSFKSSSRQGRQHWPFCDQS